MLSTLFNRFCISGSILWRVLLSYTCSSLSLCQTVLGKKISNLTKLIKTNPQWKMNICAHHWHVLIRPNRSQSVCKKKQEHLSIMCVCIILKKKLLEMGGSIPSCLIYCTKWKKRVYLKNKYFPPKLPILHEQHHHHKCFMYWKC